MSKKSFDYRDVSALLQYFRNIFLGRKHTLTHRFAPIYAPRTVPKPDIPRSPALKLHNNWYHKRSAYDSVWPPVVAPIAEGPAIGQDKKTRGSQPGGLDPGKICFQCPPTPGIPWWWDGHCYYEYKEPPPSYPCESKPEECVQAQKPPPPPPPCAPSPPGNPPCP